MSGIAGVYSFDGRPVGREVDRMVEAMEHRGPDGIQTWCDGSVGLGHCMLETTPEDQYESLPGSDPSGSFFITCDARIDNRSSLIGQLNVEKKDQTVTDSDIILESYKKWGTKCPNKIVGAFAFLIWDSVRKRLVCVRDKLGVNTLYYRESKNNKFSLATEIKSLFASGRFEKKINEKEVARILALLRNDKKETLYEGVKRLGPGHLLVIEESNVRIEKYWEISEQSRELSFNNEEYAEVFRDKLKEAVKCRTRSNTPIASQLSGGLDSSFVTALANECTENESIHTLSLIFSESKSCDERDYICKVTDKIDSIEHYIDIDQYGPLENIEKIYKYQDDGIANANHYSFWEMFAEANNQGVRVVLDGLDGDTAVMHGLLYLRKLASHFQWKSFYSEARKLAYVHANAEYRQEFIETISDPDKIFWQFGFPIIEEAAAQSNFTQVLRHIYNIKNNSITDSVEVIKRIWRRTIAPHNLVKMRDKKREKELYRDKLIYIKKSFLEEHNIIEKYSKRNYRNFVSNDVRATQAHQYRSGSVTTQLEKANHYAAAWKLENRHPFMDTRLLSYCLSLPPEQSLSNGWTRAIMRRAMRGDVPRAIRKRPGKARMSANFSRGLFKNDREKLEAILSNPGTLSDFVDIRFVKSRYMWMRKVFEEKGVVPDNEAIRLCRIAALGYRLREIENS
jgi:asparagine synthase (glutamine-hydrolysing)